MRAFVLLLFIAACGGSRGQSVCENQIPPPAACMQTCDPTPGAPKTCPSGFYCNPDGRCDAQCTQGGSECGDGYTCSANGECVSGECKGLQCQIVNCTKQGLPPTTISGKVFAPNGTLPLYGVTVYVPNDPVPAFPSGAQCSRCSDDLPGNAVVQDISKEDGSFSVTDVPVGDNIPVVVTIGKWRRQIVVPRIEQCTDNAIAAVDLTLPKSMADKTPNTTSVDIPKIAISTGSADSLECLVRKLGIADSEIGTGGGAQRIQLFNDVGSPGRGSTKFLGGAPFTDSKALWDSSSHLSPYDIVILSCEGGQYPETKSQSDMDALKAYADLGGRVFLSHWHNIWVSGAYDPVRPQKPAVWSTLGTWGDEPNLPTGTIDLIDEVSNPKGSSFATWMQNATGNPRGEIPLVGTTGRQTLLTLDTTKAERWTSIKGAAGSTQNFQFTAPLEMPESNRCGKVVFSDMHVSQGPRKDRNDNVLDYPTNCNPGDLSPQEKALAFMFFDIASCVGSLL
jgi:hypothetical protein